MSFPIPDTIQKKLRQREAETDRGLYLENLRCDNPAHHSFAD